MENTSLRRSGHSQKFDCTVVCICNWVCFAGRKQCITYSAAQIYPNYAYAYYTLVFCVYAYVYTRIRVCIYAYTRMYIRVYAYVYTRIRVCQYARICPFVMHSHKFLCMKHCWSNKGHMGMKRLQSAICILLKRHADQ